MRFEYDGIKDAQNQEKHHVSFAEVRRIWDDPDLLVLHAKRRGEKRLMAIGSAFAVVFSVVHTKREEVIRIISARRASEKEARLYEQHKRSRG